MNLARVAWYRSRAEWHGKMAAYCVQMALKSAEWDEATGAYIAGTDELSAMSYIHDAYVHARCAWTFANLVGLEIFMKFIQLGRAHADVGADVPGGGAS